jgi:hypothetical protein
VFIYNPHDEDIVVSYDSMDKALTSAVSSTVTVPATGSAFTNVIPSGSAVRLRSESTFLPLSITDCK